MSKISMDGIIAYALLQKKKSDEPIIKPKQIIKAEFSSNNLIITFDDNSTLKAPFSKILIHKNKDLLDKISLSENGKLMYDNQLICDLSEAIKKILLSDDENALVIKYFNDVEEKIELKPMIKKIFNELQGQGGETTPSENGTKNGMFFHKILNNYNELNNILKAKIGTTVVILKDVNNNNERSLYIYTGNTWQFVGSVEQNRNFKEKPINLQSEVNGVLPDNLISNTIARVTQLHNHSNLSILEKISEDNTGILLYDGKKIISNIFYDKEKKYDDINILKFRNFLGRKKGDILELMLDISSRDLRDMPKSFENNKVLVSNSVDSRYDLKKIEDLIDVKENYSTTIKTEDWQPVQPDGHQVVKKEIEHNLNSKNVIVAFYNKDVNATDYNYTVVSENKIVVKANRTDETKVVINASQGTSKNEGQGGGTIIGSDHRHSNLDLLEKFTVDGLNNLFFDGTRIFTNFNPLSYKKLWNGQNNNDLSLLLDYNKIFKEKDIRIITRSDLFVKNLNNKVDDENINKQHLVHLKIVEDEENIVLDVDINPNETQKYEVGINPKTKIYVSGYFNASIIMNYFDTSFIQENEVSPDIDVNVGNFITKRQLLEILKTEKFNDDLITGNRTLFGAINELKRQANSKASSEELSRLRKEMLDMIGEKANIRDDISSDTTTYSSEKIEELLLSSLINDETIEKETTWSSSKIDEEIQKKTQINDEKSSTKDTYSSKKIEQLIQENNASKFIDDDVENEESLWSSKRTKREIMSNKKNYGMLPDFMEDNSMNYYYFDIQEKTLNSLDKTFHIIPKYTLGAIIEAQGSVSCKLEIGNVKTVVINNMANQSKFYVYANSMLENYIVGGEVIKTYPFLLDNNTKINFQENFEKCKYINIKEKWQDTIFQGVDTYGIRLLDEHIKASINNDFKISYLSGEGSVKIKYICIKA